jgi:nucleoside-diphosphate-sugar epimerase
MTRSLVTGANGFTGRYVVNALMERGHEVHALIHSPEPVAEGVARTHVGDLADSDTIGRVLEEVRPDHIIHLAAIAFIAHGDVEEMYRTNILGTRNLLEAIACRAQPRSVILASSANIYGNAYSGILDESVRPAPANDYGITKIATEYLANIYAERLPLIVVRPFNYTGVGQAANFIVPKIVDHIRRRALKIELGNIDVERDFSDVRTVADIYARLLDAPQAVGGTYNVCSGIAVSLRQILDVITDLAGHEMSIEINPAFVRANEVRSLCGSRAKLESVIGPVDMPPLENTLRWMLET